jgi:gas vesicle protein
MYEGETYIDSRSGGNEFMIGLLVGGAVGVAVGLLLAPKSGAELRHQIADYSERFRRRAGETYDRASETMSDLAQKGKDAVNDLAQRGREAVQRGRETMDQAAETINRPASPRTADTH